MATNASSSVLTSQTTSSAIPVNYFDVLENPIAVLLLITNTPTLTASVEVTLDNPFDASITPTWQAATNGAGLTASALIKIDYPVKAVRLNVTAWTAGNAQIKVLQGDS